jgi:hypothetical protein
MAAMDGKLQTSPRLSRRWVQFRMRSLLGVMVLCGLGSSFLGRINDYYSEQEALAELRGLGGDWTSKDVFAELR